MSCDRQAMLDMLTGNDQENVNRPSGESSQATVIATVDHASVMGESCDDQAIVM